MKDLRITPEHITSLKPNEIFVFGSNMSGRHGRGAAKDALKWGAVYGKSYGRQGQTYAIPTVNATITDKLPLRQIATFVNYFLDFDVDSKYIYYVTEIGCGLAGWTVEDIAPLFKKALDLNNMYLPKRFIYVLTGDSNG